MQKILVIGDLHDYDVNLGSHKDYPANMLKIKGMITEAIERIKPTQVILTGDLCGTSFAKNFKTTQGLFNLAKDLDKWSYMSGAPIISVKGNHDMGGKPTAFDVLEFFGRLKSFYSENGKNRYIDYPGLRIHFCNYGDETLEYEIKEGVKNFLIAHSNFETRETDWYRTNENPILSGMSNMKGLDFLICGHIHIPSPKIVSEVIDGHPVDLLYLGCPTRPTKSNYNTSLLAVIEVSDDGQVDLDLEVMDLGPWEELYKESKDVEVDEEEEFVSYELLREILENTSKYFSRPDTYNDFLEKYRKTDEEAVQKALEYLEE